MPASSGCDLLTGSPNLIKFTFNHGYASYFSFSKILFAPLSVLYSKLNQSAIQLVKAIKKGGIV